MVVPHLRLIGFRAEKMSLFLEDSVFVGGIKVRKECFTQHSLLYQFSVAASQVATSIEA